MLTLRQVARRPDLLTSTVSTSAGREVVFRPLLPQDVEALQEFLASLCAETRRFWGTGGYDRAAAEELCLAIARYDKQRLVALPPQSSTPILALFELSLDLPAGDRQRFRAHGLPLNPTTDCRFGPCVRDELRGTGLAGALMPPTLEAVRRFGRTRLILWGGVVADNSRALRFYRKHGFRSVGRFLASDGQECIDMIRDLPPGEACDRGGQEPQDPLPPGCLCR